jgi:putative ATPase
LSDVVGQSHLLGEGKPLRLAFQSGKPHSMIFWGPPGVGKTTLARLTAHSFDCEFIALSAVFSGVKDIRAAMEQAEQYLSAADARFCLSMRFIALISRNRMRCCLTQKAD